jgi:hypothetical protein
MKLIRTTQPGLKENARMNESQLKFAVDFVSELIILGGLALIPKGVMLLNSCPLFMLPKSGQPDQWRCITDMNKGRQNQA